MAEISARKRIWGWWFFDWASQPYHTLLVTFIFGPYFAQIAAEHFLSTGADAEAAKAQAQSTWALCLTLTGLTIGFGAPIMGAMADNTGRKIPWMVVFSVMYVVGSGALWFAAPDGSNIWPMLIAFGLGFIGAEYALIFINSQLPEISPPDEVGEVSGSGFAFGYLGGLLALVVMLLFLAEQPNGKTLIGLDPLFGLDADEREGTRAVGPLVALWYAVFMVPYFLWVRDRNVKRGAGVGHALSNLLGLIGSLKARLSLSSFLAASMFYRDALNGLYGFGGVYAGLVLGWNVVQIGVFGILAVVSSVLFCWVGGKMDKRLGSKPVIIGSILILMGVCTLVVGMTREQIWGIPLAEGSGLPDTLFMACGVLIGGLGGVLQSSSRTLMVRHADPDKPTEYFGLYGLSGRATSFLAPALIGTVTAATASVPLGMSPVITLFAIGLILLVWVKAEGERYT